MISFQDGPAADQVLQLRRAPVYLRVTLAGDKFDALDQIADEPSPDEVIFAYQRVGQAESVHLDYTDRVTRRRRGKTYVTGEYRLVPVQPEDHVMRSREAWQAWCMTQHQQSLARTPEEHS